MLWLGMWLCSRVLVYLCLRWDVHCCDKTPQIKATWGGRCLFQLTTFNTEGRSEQGLNQGRNLKAGSEAKVTEECYLVVYYLWLDQPDFSQQTAQMWAPTMNWALLHSCINYQSSKCIIGLPTGNLVVGFSLPN